MTDSKTDHFRWTSALVVLTVIGGVLRMVGANRQLWFDEMWTLISTVRIPMADLLCSYSSDNQHTFYSFLAQLSVAAFGEHPWSLRLPAVVMGTASIPALYLLTKTITSRAEAMATAGLLALSYHHIWFSQNARGYTGLMLATTIATWCFIEGRRTTNWWPWIVYAVTVALGAYCHLTMVFVAVSHALILVVQAGVLLWKRESLWSLWAPSVGILLSGVFTLMLYAPMLGDLLAFFGRERAAITYEWMSLSWAVAETLRGLKIGFGTIALAGVAFLAAAGCWQLARRDPQTVALIVLPGLLGLLVMLALGRNIWPRFFLFVFGLALIAVVHGIWTVSAAVAQFVPSGGQVSVRRWLPVTIMALVLIQCVRMLGPLYAYPKQDLLSAIQFIETEAGANEPVATVGMATYAFLEFYQMPWTAIDDESELDQLLAKGQRTWLVYMFPIHLRAQKPEIAKRIERDFQLVRSFPATVGGGEVHVLNWQPGQTLETKVKP